MKYLFKAKNQSGKEVSGVVEAMNRANAADILQREGLTVFSIEKEDARLSVIKEMDRMWNGVSPRELVILFRELATLIRAKVAILSSLRAIQAQTQNKFLRTIIKEISDDIEDGSSLSKSMEKHPNVFSPLVISMIRSGEVSGNLQESVEYIATNIEKNYQLTSKIRGALFYPTFVIVVAIIIGFIVLTVILPKITLLIKDLDIAIPWYTKAVIWVGDFMQAYWWAVLAVMVAAVVSFGYYIRSQGGKREWDIIQLRMPILGKLFRYIYLSRFSDNFSTLLVGGIPMVQSLIIVGTVVGNSYYQDIILRAANEVKKGGSISDVFLHDPEIPPIVTQMIKIGEETGQMSETLKSVSGFYDQEVDQMTKNLTSMIEPILIVILGIGVAILVFAILLPIYDIAGQI